MKKYFLTIGTLLCLMVAPLLSTQAALAVDTTTGICQNSEVLSKPMDQRPVICQDNQTSGQHGNPLLGAKGLLTKTLELISLIVGISAIIVIIISGMRTVISAGDANSVASARRAVIYALVGLAVAAMGQAIVAFVLNKL